MNRTLNRLANLLLLTLATLCQVTLLADSFSCRIEPSLWLWLSVSCLLLWIAGSFPKGIWLGMPLSAALLYGAYRFFDADPWLELQDLIDRISGAFYTHVTHPGEAYPYADAAASHSLVLLFVGFLLAAYLITALTSKNLRISLALLETLPIFAACVVVNGTVPALASTGMLLFWFLLLVTGGGFHPDGSSARTLLCCLLPLCLLLGGLLMLHRPEDYVYTEYDIQLSHRFDQLTHLFDLLTGRSEETEVHVSDPDHPSETSGPRSSFQSSWDADDASMQLTQEYDYSQAGLRILQVRAETSGRLYLRTRSYGDYSGTGWLPAEELSSGSSLPFTAFAAGASPDGIQRELEVRTMADLHELCIPYYAAVSTGSDAFVSADGQINYRVTYTDYRGSLSALSLPADAANAEQIYRAHAHSVYTRLPDSTKAAALRICQEAGFRADDAEIIQAIAEYVQGSGEYDLRTGAYPSDDYAIYFLTQAHRGYCIHYATAAAVLYRALGIPARVTEGFVAETRAGALMDVLAGDAHAWVEVYRDGLGWIPVEVTAGAGFATEETEPRPAPTPEPSIAPQGPAENSPDPVTGPEPSPAPPLQQPEQPPQPETSRFPWQTLLILPALGLLLLLWYWLASARFRSQIRNPNGRKAVLACWRYARRAAAFGGEIPGPIVSAAEKVTFSPHTIRKEEAELCRRELLELIDAVYPKLHPLGKFRFRFLRGLR